VADASAGSGSRRYWMPKRRGLAVKRSPWVIGGSDNRKASAQHNAGSFRDRLLRRAFSLAGTDNRWWELLLLIIMIK